MNIIDTFKKCLSVTVIDRETNKKRTYSNVHLVETPSWRSYEDTVLVLRGDYKQYTSCLIVDFSFVKTNEEYNNKNGIEYGGNYIFVS